VSVRLLVWRSLGRTIHHLLPAALLLSTASCSLSRALAKPVAPNDWKEKVLSESVDEKAVRYGNNKHVEIERDGVSLSITVRQLCEVTRRRSIERTGTVEYENNDKWNTARYLGLGVALAAGSVALSVHAARVDPNDEEATKAVPAMAAGAVLLGVVGTVFLGVGTLYVIGASGSDEKTEVIERKEELPARPCKQDSQPSAKLKLEPERRSRPRSVSLGKTNKQGKLVVTLSEVIPASWLSGSKPSKYASVLVDGRRAGKIEIASLSGDVSERAWARISRAIAQCKTSTKRRGCRNVKRFIKRHPKSPRAAEAKQLLDDHIERQHDHAWAAAKIKTCARPKTSRDCRGVRRYLRRYRKGEHATEARAVLKKIDKKLDALAKREEARDEREARAEARREAAEERREAAKQKRVCLKDCRAEFSECNRSCRGLSSAFTCRRNCRGSFVSCELGCAREERGSRSSRPRGKSSITLRLGRRKPKSACGTCRAAWRRQCPHDTSICNKVISNNCASYCN
jgi:hypothetical protein